MGIRELFLEIFKKYPAEFNADPKIKTNSYYSALKEEIRRTFAPFLKFQIEIDALGEFMRKQPYICFLAKGHQRDRGMYPIYLFDFDKKTVLLEFENGNDSPEFTEAFAARAAELLPEFKKRDDDGYPRKIYTKDELDEKELVNDLKQAFEAYQSCLEEFDEDIQAYLNPDKQTPKQTIVSTSFDQPRYWAIAPGENARLWDDFKQNNIIAIGWDKLGDFLQYPDKEAIRQSLQQLDQTEGYKTNDTLACYEFAYVMKIGDYVLAKKGLYVIIGFGQITSDYIYDDSRTEYHHVREVRWFAYGEWKIPEGVRTIIPKTLTNITTYKERLQKILDLIHVPSHAQIDKPNTPSALTPKPTFSKADALAKLFLSDAEFDDILDLLRYKNNIILQGPPGVGKSFIAKQIAFALLEAKDEERVEMIQFHQAYAYEDFMQGFRPNDDGKFALKNGVFYEFCKRAQRNPAPHVFIIDEINRGNLSKIFGELMLLIEPDKRGRDFAMPLTYAPHERFFLPENLYVIGLMNTADRSLAMVDYALRRRFVFINLAPQFQSAKFTEYLRQRGIPEDLIGRIVAHLTALNQQIAQDPNLGKGFCVGHSFFCPNPAQQAHDERWYERVVNYEIQPLLEEYWFDNSEKAAEAVKRLLA